MKTELNPLVVIAVIVVLVGGVVFWFWKGSQGVNGSNGGKLQSNLGKVETDPAKFQKGVDDSLKKDREAHQH